MIPEAPKMDRRGYVGRLDLTKYGYTDECLASTQRVVGMCVEEPHDDMCRDRIGELMADDAWKQEDGARGHRTGRSAGSCRRD